VPLKSKAEVYLAFLAFILLRSTFQPDVGRSLNFDIFSSRDSIITNSNIGLYRWCSGSIDNGSTSDNYIEPQVSAPLN
jgi:hypothetical protein